MELKSSQYRKWSLLRRKTGVTMDRKTAESKAKQLAAQMTLEEKASQLRYDAPAIERLGIPAYNWWNEALHGVARAGTATVFPQAIGLAASFDPEMNGEIGRCIADEGRAKYNEQSKRGDRDIYKGLTFWSPNVNIFRDPRWGRGHETYGEDPVLTARMAVPFIKGIQHTEDGVTEAAACAKHFAVHSGPEAIRHEFNAVVSKKDMEETYLPAFKACVKEAGVDAVMGAYNRTNDEPCCGSKTLLGDILRGRWGFEGQVVSDCGAIQDFHEYHHVTKTAEESAALALNNGCDLNCGTTYLRVLQAVQEGLISEETVTEACVRNFTLRYMLGMMGEQTPFDALGLPDVESGAHLKLAYRAACESTVLLKNNGLLPLKKDAVHTIGVIGPNADSRKALIGNYHGTSSEYITILDGIRAAVGEDTRILYSQGCDLAKDVAEPLAQAEPGDRLAEASAVASYSDVVVLVLGLDETLEGEEGDAGNAYYSGDKGDLLLPKPQRKLMETVLACGKPVVVINMTGSAVDLSPAEEKADAVLQVWYPGARGGRAVADILFGDAAPSGKLPVTFYQRAEDVPEFTDYAMKGRTYRYFDGTPLYPFGYGLTYGDTEVTDLTVSAVFGDAPAPAGVQSFEPAEGGKMPEEPAGLECFYGAQARVTVVNHGIVPVEDVVEVYVKDEDFPLAVPHPALAGFARVELAAGETKELVIDIPRTAFTGVDEDGIRLIRSRRFTVYAGFSQPDSRSEVLTGHACRKAELGI